MLPENFFTYKNKDPCKGCRGCKEDDDEFSTDSTSTVAVAKSSTQAALTISSAPASSVISTPVRTTVSVFHSPMTSFYGTPSNFDKTVDTSIFRTPLGSKGVRNIGSNTNSISPATPVSTSTEKNVTNKENTFTQKNIFGSATPLNMFGNSQGKSTSTSASNETQNTTTSKSAILAAPKLSTVNTSGGENLSPDAKSVFGSAQTKSVFDENKSMFGHGTTSLSTNKSIFGMTSDKKDEEAKNEVKSIFGGDCKKPENLFTNTGQGSIFSTGTLANNQQKPGVGIFSSGGSIFGSNTQSQGFVTATPLFGSAANQPQCNFGKAAEEKKQDGTTTTAPEDKKEEVTKESDTVKDTPFKVDNTLSFAALSSGEPTGFIAQKKPDFRWEGAGQQLFTSAQKNTRDAAEKSKNESGADDSGAGAEEEYDPHYEPIVPLPDKIVVTTGEEDEEKLFGKRCKLYRYDDKAKEWKERGVGEMKILYHPERKTYRLLLRREQVHKAVLNMLIVMDLELLAMKNSDRAWTWAGCNFAENPQGEQEMLAVRFKSVDLANNFKDKMVECTRKLQVAAAQAVKEEKEADKPAPLRLPKHLESSARADPFMSTKTEAGAQHTTPTASHVWSQSEAEDASNGTVNRTAEVFKQVHFQEPENDHCEEDEEVEDYEHDYDHNDYDEYYNEDEETGAYYECAGEAVIEEVKARCENAHIQVLFDQDVYSPKILVTDADTGEILADTLIHTDTEFQMEGNSCQWLGTDYTSNNPVDKLVTINFMDSDTAMQFYDSCETSKGATYTSTDPES